MKKIYLFKTLLLLCALVVGSGSAWAEEASFAPSNFSGQGTSGSGSAISATVDGVTFACDKGYGTTQIRCYSGGKITISSSNTITAISFTFSGTYTGGLETSYTNLSTNSWENNLTSQARITAVTVTYTSGGGGTPTVTTPTFSPAAGAVAEGTEVTIINYTSDAIIYYTTDGSTPSASNGTQGTTVTITQPTTIKAIAVKDGMNDSEVATAAYTIKKIITNYTIDFEDELDCYVKWAFNNVGNTNNAITAHSGSKYGANINDNGNATSTASFQTKETVAYPGTFTCYVSKTSNNTTESSWKIQVSSDGSSWTDVKTQSATSMSKGAWTEFTADIKDAGYTNVYVRLYYDGSNAIRAVDDISLTTYSPAAVEKPRFSLAAGSYYGTQNVTLSCTTEDAIIYYTTDGTDPTSSNTLYSAPISVTEDMTIKAIAIKGSDESEIAEATYTILPKDDVVFDIDDQTLTYGSTFTLMADGHYLTDGTVTLVSDNDVVTIDGLTITAAAVGTATITVNAAEGATYNAGSTTFTVTVTAPEGQTTAAPSTLTIFEETFASCDGTGGNDDKWSGSIASSTLVADNKGWTFSNGSGADKCAKFGSSSAQGSATTPALGTAGTLSLSFRAGAWNTADEGTTLNLSVSEGTISAPSVTLTKGEFNTFTATISNATANTKITFEAENASKNRFFLDDVVVSSTAPAITVNLNASGYATFCSQYPFDFTNASGYSAWQITSIGSDDKVTFEQITGSVKGGTGIFLKGTAGETIELTSADSETVLSGNKLVGTMVPTYVAADEYYGLSGNTFVKVNAGKVPAGKALLPASQIPSTGNARSFTFIFADEATGISEVEHGILTADETVYDLQGRRVVKAQKGLYIVNGKKVAIK